MQALLDSEKAVIKKLEYQYRAALHQIDEKIRILQSDELTQSKIYHLQYQQALKGQVQAIIEKLHGDEYTTIQQYLHDSYTDSFVGTMYNLHGQGMPLIIPIDQKQAVKAIMTDSQINEGLYEALGVDAQKLKKAISSEIARGIASSLTYAEIARNISNASRAPLSRAGSLLIPDADLALSLMLNNEAFPSVEVDRMTALSYLHRDAITLPSDTEKGYVVIRHEGLPLGFVKNLGNRCNSLHPQSRRIRMDINR